MATHPSVKDAESHNDARNDMLSRAASALTSILLEPTGGAEEWFDRCGRALGTLVNDGATEGAIPSVRIGGWSPIAGWIGNSAMSEWSTYGVRLLTSAYAENLSAGRVFARSDVMDDAQWGKAELARTRAALGFGDFVEGHFDAPWIGGRCVLLVTADQRVGGAGISAWDQRRIMTVFSCLGPAVRDGFVHSVATPAKRRAEVLARVSASQRQILLRLVEGETEREIAEKLVRSPHTVHDHVKAIYSSLGVSSRYELFEVWSGRVELAAPEDSKEAIRP